MLPGRNFDCVITPGGDLVKLSVKDIRLIGEKTGTHHTLKDIQGDKVRVYGERKFIRISAGPLTADEYQYQNYILKAKVEYTEQKLILKNKTLKFC